MRLLLILVVILLVFSWFYLGHLVFNNRRKLLKIIWIFVTALPFFTLYFLTNPSVSYYKSQFTEFSGFEFPSNSIFIDYSSSFPDFQKGYSVCGMFEAPGNFIQNLNATIPKIQNDQYKPRMFCKLNSKSKYYSTNIINIDDKERRIIGTLGTSSNTNVVYFQFFQN